MSQVWTDVDVAIRLVAGATDLPLVVADLVCAYDCLRFIQGTSTPLVDATAHAIGLWVDRHDVWLPEEKVVDSFAKKSGPLGQYTAALRSWSVMGSPRVIAYDRGRPYRFEWESVEVVHGASLVVNAMMHGIRIVAHHTGPRVDEVSWTLYAQEILVYCDGLSQAGGTTGRVMSYRVDEMHVLQIHGPDPWEQYEVHLPEVVESGYRFTRKTTEDVSTIVTVTTPQRLRMLRRSAGHRAKVIEDYFRPALKLTCAAALWAQNFRQQHIRDSKA